MGAFRTEYFEFVACLQFQTDDRAMIKAAELFLSRWPVEPYIILSKCALLSAVCVNSEPAATLVLERYPHLVLKRTESMAQAMAQRDTVRRTGRRTGRRMVILLWNHGISPLCASTGIYGSYLYQCRLRESLACIITCIKRAKDATLTFLLCAKSLPIHRDVALLIAKMVWEYRKVDYVYYSGLFAQLVQHPVSSS